MPREPNTFRIRPMRLVTWNINSLRLRLDLLRRLVQV
jgi:hypothetical protein